MATVSFPHTFRDGPGNIASGVQVMANLNAILAAVNGGLDRTNLAAALQAAIFSPGDVRFSASSVVPTGWLACDFSAVSRATYADLFAAIGTAYGAGDRSTTFNLPSARDTLMLAAGTAYPRGSTLLAVSLPTSGVYPVGVLAFNAWIKT